VVEMSQIIIRQILPDEEYSVYELISDCFNKFIAPDYNSRGKIEFLKFIDPTRLKNRIMHKTFMFVAVSFDKIVGVIEIRDNNHISLLFVNEKFQKMGIAKRLIQKSIQRASKFDPSLKKITVNSSSYALEIYKKLGFEEKGEQKEENGIIFIPMEMEIKK
jgi:ribosomal protein S18 acetylase RimI-like enzyme